MAGINIAFASDVRSFLTGTKDAERGMERVGDSLDDLARDGKDAGAKIERTFHDTFDEVRRDAKAKTDNIADDTKHNMAKAGESSGDFKREAIANLSETASSFDGSMDDIASMIQGTFGGLADLPGVGLGVAALGALGGVVYSMWKSSAEDTEKRTQEMFDAMVESGANYLTQTQVQAAMKTLYDDDGKMDQVRSAAERLGMSVESVATAYVTAGGARDEVQARAAAAIDEELALRQQLAASVEQGSRDSQVAAGREIEDSLARAEGYQTIIDRINGQSDAEGDAATRVEEYRRAVALAQANVRAEYATTATTQGKTTQDAIDDMRRLSSSITGLPQRIPLTLDTTALDAELARPRTIKVGIVARPGQVVAI